MNVSRNTLVEQVANELRRLISSGEIQPGGFLPSRKELAARFGVGVSTVHEAIQALAAVGLVESHAGKGTWMRQDALETLIHPAAVETRFGVLQARQVWEARSVIEVALTQMAAERATAGDVDRIWATLAQMEASLEDDDAFVDADVAFHLAVAQAGHNELLEQFYHLSRKLLATTIGELVRLPGVKEEAVAIQRSIAQAIADRDGDRARQAAVEHMGIIEDLLGMAEAREGR
jgi:GntR family transcriptional regulator, transcriptional repressor for pyruvate dehydrogenase complex